MYTSLLPADIKRIVISKYINNINNIKVEKHLSRGNRVVSCGRIDRQREREREREREGERDRYDSVIRRFSQFCESD